MQNVDRYTKVMLTLLVVGVWVMLLRPVFQPVPAQAQQTGNMGVYAEDMTLKGERKIGVFPSDTFGGRINYVLPTAEMPRAVQDANARGWKIKAVAAVNGNAGETVGYTIFVEK